MVISTLALGIAAAAVEEEWLWLAGALAVGAVLPYTLVFMLRLNDSLKHMTPDDPVAIARLRTWGQLHLVRGVLGLAGLVLMLVAAMP